MRRRRRHQLQLALFPLEACATAADAVPPAPLDESAVPPLPTARAPETARLRPAPLPPSPRPDVPPGLRSADARRLVWLHAQGVSLTALAAQFHTSRLLVRRYIQDPTRIRELEAQEALPRPRAGRAAAGRRSRAE
jgi:hypothetical protein